MRTEKHVYRGSCDDCGKQYDAEFPRETSERDSMPKGWMIFNAELCVYGNDYFSDTFKEAFTFCDECSLSRMPTGRGKDEATDPPEKKNKILAIFKKIKFVPSKWVRRNFDY